MQQVQSAFADGTEVNCDLATNELIVNVTVKLLPNGRLAGPPFARVNGRSVAAMASRDSAVRAVLTGQPFDSWFNPLLVLDTILSFLDEHGLFSISMLIGGRICLYEKNLN
jgi:hypothetical protein